MGWKARHGPHLSHKVGTAGGGAEGAAKGQGRVPSLWAGIIIVVTCSVPGIVPSGLQGFSH